MKKTLSYIFGLLVLAAAIVVIFSYGNRQDAGPIPHVDESVSREEEKSNDSALRIVAAGDSLTAGYNLPLSDSYPKILERKLLESGKNVVVINAGISGETTAGLLERAEFISQQKPDLLLISTGGNDFFRNLPIESTRENIERSIEIFKQTIKAENIYLLKIEATANLGLKYRGEFNAIYKEIADKQKINLLPFVVSEVFLDSRKMLPDAIHPNRDGYEFIVDTYIFPEMSKKISR